MLHRDINSYIIVWTSDSCFQIPGNMFFHRQYFDVIIKLGIGNPEPHFSFFVFFTWIYVIIHAPPLFYN
jgi:hypothetical protein